MSETERTYVPLRRLNWPVVLLLFFLMAVCLFAYKYLNFVANGEKISPLVPLVEEFGGITAAILLFPFVYWVAIRFPLLSKHWWRYLPIHLLTVCLFSFCETSLMWLQRRLFFPILGLGEYHYGYMPVRYVMEFANHFLIYWAGLAFVYLYHEVRFARERELQQSRLEANLAQAQLQNLRLQLEPHFLFNALNAISTAIYENPRMADEMIGRLSELLRQLLRNDRSQEISLSQEIELLTLYTRMMEARFEDRLVIQIHVEPQAKDALVPQLILQPVVENAIRYGSDPETFRIKIEILAQRKNGHLQLSVRDYGSGLPADFRLSDGIGLRNTKERLERLYGPDHALRLQNAADGGLAVEMDLPYRQAELMREPS